MSEPERPFDLPGDYASWPDAERLRFIRHHILHATPGTLGPQLRIAEELDRILARLRAIEQSKCPRCDGHTGVCLTFEEWDVVARALTHANTLLDRKHPEPTPPPSEGPNLCDPP